MKIEIKDQIREIVADKGKLIVREGTEVSFPRGIMFPEETEDDYNEILETIIEGENENE